MGTEGYKPSAEEESEARHQSSYGEAVSSSWREDMVEKYGLERLKGTKLSIERSGNSKTVAGTIDGKNVRLIFSSENGKHTYSGEVGGVEQSPEDADRLYNEYSRIARYLEHDAELAEDIRKERGEDTAQAA